MSNVLACVLLFNKRIAIDPFGFESAQVLVIFIA